eukprot:3177328-Rhodomonas_salina.1
MENLEQLYVCGVRLRGESGDIAALLQQHGFLHAELSPILSHDLPVVRVEDNCDWNVEERTLTQANALVSMVDSLSQHTFCVTAVQILEKVWEVESDKD